MLKRIKKDFFVLFIVSTILFNIFANVSFIESIKIDHSITVKSHADEDEIISYNLKQIGNFDFAKAVVDVFVVNQTAYLADEGKGLLVVNISDLTNPELLGTYQDNDESVYAVEIRGDYAFLAHGSSGLKILDITDPKNIVEISTFDDGGFAWDVFLTEDYAFLVDRSQGVEIIDITNLEFPLEIAQYDSKPFSIFVEESYAYIAAGIGRGLEILDISEITNPKKIGEIMYELEDAVDIYVKEGYAFVAMLENGLKVFKITNPRRPTLVSQFLDDKIGNAWGVSSDEEFLYLADEEAGIEVIDFSDPEKPKEIAQFCEGENGNSYNIFIDDELIFVADYAEGLEIVTWKTAKPIPTTSDYKIISNATLNFNNSVGPFELNGIVGNESVGLNLSLLMDVGLKSPINITVEAPEIVLPGEDTNLKILIASEASSFWAKFIGTIALESPLGSTEIISLEDAGIPNIVELAAFRTFIGRNLSEDTSLTPVILWEDELLNVTLKLIMTPKFNVTGSAIVSALINNENKTIEMDWLNDNETVIVPISIPEVEEFYTVKLEDFKFIIDDLRLDFYSLRFDVVALDLVPIYTWELNFDDLFNGTIPAIVSKSSSLPFEKITKNQENNRTLLFLDGEYLLGDYIILIYFTKTISLPPWAIALALLGILLLMAIPWILIFSTSRRNKPKPEDFNELSEEEE